MGLRIVIALLLCRAVFLAGAPQPALTVSVSVLDRETHAVPGVRVELTAAQDVVAFTDTDPQGHAEFTRLKPGHYQITATKTGLEPIRRDLDLSPGQSISAELTAIPMLTRREGIEVRGTIAPVEQGASAPND